jgi:hypothetical protein
MISPLDHLLLSAEGTSTVPLKERLRALRQSLQQACQQIESQISALDDPASTGVPQAPAPSPHSTSLFETAPVGIRENRPSVGSIEKILAPAANVQIDPLLEKATLEELNAALSQAFSQIAAKRVW